MSSLKLMSDLNTCLTYEFLTFLSSYQFFSNETINFSLLHQSYLVISANIKSFCRAHISSVRCQGFSKLVETSGVNTINDI